MTALHDFCIYTIVDGSTLQDRASRVPVKPFTERKRWVTGERLWAAAKAKKRSMPVLFGDARDCSKLLYWGILTSVDVRDDGTTRYQVDQLRKLTGRRSPQELTLRKTGKTIAPNFIKPYAICQTPTFIRRSR
jgi:hypothetical protein